MVGLVVLVAASSGASPGASQADAGVSEEARRAEALRTIHAAQSAMRALFEQPKATKSATEVTCVTELARRLAQLHRQAEALGAQCGSFLPAHVGGQALLVVQALEAAAAKARTLRDEAFHCMEAEGDIVVRLGDPFPSGDPTAWQPPSPSWTLREPRRFTDLPGGSW